MAEVLDQVIARLRELPDDVQETAGKQLLQYVDEISTLDDRSDELTSEMEQK